ncbi:hypothetical protein [Legionella parisiensis]|uniref:Uncharacterized protein n=1 Tax=Legionella parisiensis TaxID=45071 RepID=A0A1E5JUG4_9GAMM|nr:hypothetical protein [Legionella parisiensis]KTD40843.1 hypothetical protein Lpar_2160 [Legionella parisiensis]OEH48176.1 hypothetical protein lpari_00826 [Legionella parisiensis]STX72215.1 Uncharacterised protein [Legionella parisiensis]
MKWIILLGSVVLMAGCCCTSGVTYYTPSYTPVYARTVTYKPVVTYRPVVTRVVTPVVQPVTVYSYPVGPLDVTTTTIDFY